MSSPEACNSAWGHAFSVGRRRLTGPFIVCVYYCSTYYQAVRGAKATCERLDTSLHAAESLHFYYLATLKEAVYRYIPKKAESLHFSFTRRCTQPSSCTFTGTRFCTDICQKGQIFNSHAAACSRTVALLLLSTFNFLQIYSKKAESFVFNSQPCRRRARRNDSPHAHAHSFVLGTPN